jgi:hypothetical protein
VYQSSTAVSIRASLLRDMWSAISLSRDFWQE